MDVSLAIVMVFFLGAALQDHARGMINGLVLIIPAGILAFAFPGSFMWIYGPILLIMISIWAVLSRLPQKFKDQGIVIGFGDVLAVPLALGISHAAQPFFGPVAFAAVYAALLPPFLRKKSRRLLPWLVPPVAAALLLGLLL